MTGHGAKFGRKKEEAVAALLVHRSVEEAAKAIGVDPKTLRKWQKIPEFEAAYRQARRDAFQQTDERTPWIMRPELLRRLTALEGKQSAIAGQQKSMLPEWLTKTLVMEQGARLDGHGRLDLEWLRAVQSARLPCDAR